DFSGRLTTISAVVDHRHSRHDATIPEDHNGPAVLPLFCLAPHGVFRASRITPRAVSSYLAFSPLPALLSKNRRCLFCDTFRQRPLSRTLPAYSTRHAAVWCSDFPPANLAIHQRSSAIGTKSSIEFKIWKPRARAGLAENRWVQRHTASWIPGFPIRNFPYIEFPRIKSNRRTYLCHLQLEPKPQISVCPLKAPTARGRSS